MFQQEQVFFAGHRAFQHDGCRKSAQDGWDGFCRQAAELKALFSVGHFQNGCRGHLGAVFGQKAYGDRQNLRFLDVLTGCRRCVLFEGQRVGAVLEAI